MIDVADFQRVEMRVGRVVRAERFPESRKPAYKLWIDFGEFGIKTSSAQVTELYRPEELVDQLVVAVVNLPMRRVAGFPSEVLVLGVNDEQGRVVLLAPERVVPLGGHIY